MRVRAFFIGFMADSLGVREVEVELPEGAGVGDLLEALARRLQGFASLVERLPMVVAYVDGREVGPSERLRDGLTVYLSASFYEGG
ncbi:MAG: MoaD/ThiS family protein [Desulfurococcaceae archaeon]